MRSFILLCVVALALSVSVTEMTNRRKFAEFQVKYGKSYSNAEESEHRFRIFNENLNKANILKKSNPRATFGVNEFSDLSSDEFAAKYLMKNVDFGTYVKPAAKDFTKASTNNVRACNPSGTSYDWNSCGAVTPVYNQGACGSCWAFSATECIESYFFLGGNPLTELAMEQIVDCDTAGSDEGCNGGFPSGAYEYVESAGGIEPLSDYPYTAEGGESGSCAFNSGDVVATVTNYVSINGETGMYQQLSSSSGGPISVCVDASSWQSYTGGVLSQCGTSVDHCVMATGYTNYGESGAYWNVRNSWGTSWGEQGYIYIEIGQDLCAIGDYATVVTATTA